MITLHMNLKPPYIGGPAMICDAQIWTSDCGDYHNYCFTDCNGNTLAEGFIMKTKSGHRNPLHLLSDIMDNIDLDDFDKDYVSTDYDRA